LIHKYYISDDDETDTRDGSFDIGLPFTTPRIDEAFQAQVWTWLTQTGEFQIGSDGMYSHLSLADSVAHNHGLQSSVGQDPQKTTSNRGSKIPATNEPVKVYTTEERMWFALTGHAPDKRRLSPLEFMCLSIIGARREEGILQPDLVRASAQDKRTVPRRTDKLHNEGYIVKTAVVALSTKTSHLVLKRLANAHPPKSSVYVDDLPNTIPSYSKIFRKQQQNIFWLMMRQLEHSQLIVWDQLKADLVCVKNR
jgi:hypothetical protein